MSSHVRMSPIFKTGYRLAKLSLLVIALSGCAAQLAYRDGRDLVAQDQVEAGLLKFQDAMTRDPGNALYKAAYLQARERATGRHLELAERALAAGESELASQQLQLALQLEPQNERARAGLRTLEMQQRHEQLLAAASAALDARQDELARQQLNAILIERPQHEAARAMLRLLAGKNPPAPAETGLALAFRQPITIEFRDAPLKQVFEVIAHHSGLNFVFDKDVKTDTKVSIFLKKSTVESAIYFTLMTNQLEQQVMDGNTILIYPNVAAKLKEYREMVVKTFFIANADAKALANTLKTILQTRDVVVDEKLNLLIVRDSPEAIRLAERLVALQDVPEPEVMLDVEILEIKRSRLLELGVAWPTSLTLSPLTASGGSIVTLADLRQLNQGRIGVSSLSAKVNANKTDGDTNILANPRIRVRNKEKAKILIGDKVPVITTVVSPGTGGFAADSISYIDVGLTLNAEPTIYLNNEVAIRISLEVSNLVNQIQTKNGTTAYQIGTRQASTMLQLKDGENQVLAGLINNEDRSTGSKVPGFGDIPLLGRLFGSTQDDNAKTEIVLSITPHLIRNIVRPEAQASEFSAGTEGSFRRRPNAQVVPVALEKRVSAPPAPATATGTAFVLAAGQPVPLPSAPLQLSAGQPVPVLPPVLRAPPAPKYAPPVLPASEPTPADDASQ